MRSDQKSKFRIIRACYHTVDGLIALWRQEESFRQEFYASVILLPVIYFLNVAATLKLLLLLLLLLMLVVETINSALETIVDRISLAPHPQSKVAKDMGSAAVGMVIFMNVLTWVYALFVHFL